jgi:hypothetical protein
MKIDVEPYILIYAFRYALGRMSYAVGDVADTIIEHWDSIRDNDRNLIIREINEAIESGCAGMEVDINTWKRVLNHATEKGE